MYEYKIKTIDHIVDGDTFDCTVDLGFNISHKIRVRMYGINTPESRTRDLEEKARGKAAKARLLELLNDCGRKIVLRTTKRGKYGRILGKLLHPVTLENFNQTLLKEGHATRMVF